MATCLEDTEEKSRGSKLSRLLIDGGTERLQKTFDGIHPPSTLAAALRAQRPTLTHLRHKRIINSSQWDKLFPPSGGAPDSKQFDITLLYILLRNICGLTPPVTGWDALPSATDTTLEANLARIKFYRNEVYGYINSTGVPKAEFEQYWSEISGALVALGMDPISIDILKTLPLGTNGYLNLLEEWTVSDQTVKALTEKARKAAEDTKEVVSRDVKQVNENVKQLVTESQKARIAAERTETKLEKLTSQLETAVKEITEKARSASEGAKTEVKTATTIMVTQETARQGMTESEKGRIATEKTQHIAELAMTESQKANLAAQDANMFAEKHGNEVGTLMRSGHMKKHSGVLTSIARSNFTGHIKSLVDHYHPGTRTWILSDIQEFVDSNRSQLMVVTARPGVGKSVLAAVTSQTMEKQGQLAACHFMEHGNSLRNSPRLIIQSIASHLCDSIPGFQQALEEQLSRDVGKDLNSMNCEEVFTLLLEEPLNGIAAPHKHKLIIIDALDECDSSQKDEFVKALEGKLPKLPKWVKCLVTTRPVPRSIPIIPSMTNVSIESKNENDANNLNDIQLYLRHRLQQLYPLATSHEIQESVFTLANGSDGIFLHAYYQVTSAKERKPDLLQIHKTFPEGIFSVYEDYFTRLIKELNFEEQTFFDFLAVIVAAQDLLPEDFVLEILGLNGSSRKVKKEGRQTLRRLSQLFVIREKHVSVFHKSIIDWLTGTEEHDFSVNVEDGHHVLAQHCLPYLKGVKKHRSSLPTLNDCERYSLRFGFYHMLKTGGNKGALLECLTDLEILNIGQNTFPNFLQDLTEYLLEASFRELPVELQIVMDHISRSRAENLLHRVLQAAAALYSVSHDTPEDAALCENFNEVRQQAVQLLITPKYRDVLYIEPTELEFELPLHLEYISELQVSSSGKFVLCVGWAKDEERRVPHDQEQNCKTGLMIMTYNGATGKCQAKVCVEGTMRTDTRYIYKQEIDILFGDYMQFLTGIKCVMSDNDKYVSVLTSNYCDLRDMCSLQLHKRLQVDSEPLCSCFVQDGKRLLTGHENGKIRVWHVESGVVKSTLDGHGEKVLLCITSPCTGQVLTVDEGGITLLCQPPDYPQTISVSDRVNIPGSRVLKPRAAFSLTGTKVAVYVNCCFLDCKLIIYSTKGGKLVSVFSMDWMRNDHYCRFMAFVNDTHVLVQELEGSIYRQIYTLLNINSGNKQVVGQPKWCQMLRCKSTDELVPELLSVHQSHPDHCKLVSLKLNNIH